MSSNESKTILVFGATGNQGYAVAKSLVSKGFKVKAVSRNPDSSKSESLKQQGMEVVKADLNDEASMEVVMQGVHGVFSVQNFMDVGVEVEKEQGIKVANVAKKTGINHLVYSSVGGAERKSGVAHFESKGGVERKIMELQLPYTILRPVLFIENFANKQFAFGMLTLIRNMLGKKKLQVISVEDIGEFAALAFSEPEKYLNKAIEIGSDELNYDEMQDVFKSVLGKKKSSIWLPKPLIQLAFGEIGKMFTWFDQAGYQANIEECKKEVPDMLSFRDWVEKNKEKLI